MKTISNPIIWILLVLITSCTSIEEPGLKDETSSQTATRSQIARRIYAREFILSSNNQDDNGDWMPDTSDEVYWTLPVKRGLITDPPIVLPAH